MTLTSISESEALASAPSQRSARPGALFDSIIPLLGLGALLLLAIGLLSCWVIKRTTQDYSNLMAQTALDLDRLHDISYHAGIGSATAIQLVVTKDSSQRAAMLHTIAEERRANNAIFDDFLHQGSDARWRTTLQDVLAKRSVFQKSTDRLIQGVSTHPVGWSNTNCMALLESFITYQKAVDSLADLIRASSLQASYQVAQGATRFRLLLFAAGVLPMVLGLLGIALAFYLILVTPHEVDLKG